MGSMRYQMGVVSVKFMAISLVFIFCIHHTGGAQEKPLVCFEAESFPIQGGWTISRDNSVSFLVREGEIGNAGDMEPAATLVLIPQSGSYRLWVRARDYAANGPATRKFKISLGEKKSDGEFGTHQKEGWHWQDGGVFDLPAGYVKVQLHGVTGWARCDKILLTADGGAAPKGAGPPGNATQTPLVTPGEKRPFIQQPRGEEVVARLSHGPWVLEFRKWSQNQKPALAPQISYLGEGVLSPAIHQYFMWVFDQSNRAQYTPNRSHSPVFLVKGKIEAGGLSCEGWARTHNPFVGAGEAFPFWPSKLVRENNTEVILEEKNAQFQARVRYSFSNDFPFVEVSLVPKKEGFATVGAYAFPPLVKEACESVLLPYYYQARRFPEEILLLPSSMGTAPLSLIQTRLGQKSWSFAISANLRDEKFAWLTYENSFAALTLQNPQGQYQPGLFAPVPATRGAHVVPGKPIQFSFFIYGAPKVWNEAFGELATGVLGADDVRKNWQGSLHGAVFNMQDLLSDDAACGWEPRHKGFLQIENKNTVSQSSPLALMELYWLTGDEQLFETKALPTAAFLFTRNTQHFPTHPTDFGSTYVKKVSFEGPVTLFGTSTFQGFDRMFKGRAPVFQRDGMLSNGEPRWNGGYSSIQKWGEYLYAYRLTRDPKYLAKATADALAEYRNLVSSPPKNSRDYQSFVKMAIPPYLWSFLDLYEETGNRELLDASRLAADYLLTTSFIHPYPFQETYQVTRSEVMSSLYPTAMWRGPKHTLLGFDQGAIDRHQGTILLPPEDFLKNRELLREETVPAWLVSGVGAGIEQPYTLSRGRVLPGKEVIDTPLYGIRLNCESASLMRLWGLTGEKKYWVYGRNATLGQFNNYPGYYVSSFSTTERAAAFPHQGPDISSSIYFHHIPVQLASAVDFLYSSAAARSGGQVKFPAVRQQGYVWFVSEIFGHESGNFYGYPGVYPILGRGLFEISSAEVNAVAGVASNAFCLFLMNEEDREVPVVVTLPPGKLRFPIGSISGTRWSGQGKPEAFEMTPKNEVSLVLGKKGTVALIFKDVTLQDQSRFEKERVKVLPTSSSYHRGKDPASGLGIQAYLFPHPLRDKYWAFVNTDALDGPVALDYRVGEGPWTQTNLGEFPYEAMIPVVGLGTPFSFRVGKTDEKKSKELRLYFELAPVTR